MSDRNHAAQVTGQIARITPAPRIQDQAALAVLEQMYGYFSYEPLPLEADELLTAA